MRYLRRNWDLGTGDGGRPPRQARIGRWSVLAVSYELPPSPAPGFASYLLLNSSIYLPSRGWVHILSVGVSGRHRDSPERRLSNCHHRTRILTSIAMTEPPKPKTPRKGVLSRLNKLEIPLYRKKKKGPPTEAERTAAEFLSVQSGKIVEALDCGPDSGVAVVVEGDDAFIQVDIPSEPTGDGGDGNGAPKSPKL